MLYFHCANVPLSGSCCWLSKCFEDIYICFCCIVWDKSSGVGRADLGLAYCNSIYLLYNPTFSLIQLEDNNLRLILDILCKIYRGEVCMCHHCEQWIIYLLLDYWFCLWMIYWKLFIGWCRNHSVISFGTGIVLLMDPYGVSCATWRVNFQSGLWNSCDCYRPSVKELGQLSVCEWNFQCLT